MFLFLKTIQTDPSIPYIFRYLIAEVHYDLVGSSIVSSVNSKNIDFGKVLVENTRG